MIRARGIKRIYLDYASLTPVDSRVTSIMNRISGIDFGNPSALHAEGVRSKRMLDESRRRVANELHALPDEIIFTGSGTEANNLAILGLFKKLMLGGVAPNKLHAVMSSIDHSSVRECFRHLSELGVDVDTAPVDSQGYIDARGLRKVIKANTILVSILHVNNEIGTVQSITEIARTVRHARKINTIVPGSTFPLLHTDACQSLLYFEIDVRKLGADLVTVDGSKIHGPRGIGCLWKRRHIILAPQILGGGQESGLRSGTENLAAICGFAEALTISRTLRHREASRLRILRTRFIKELIRTAPTVIMNGDIDNGAPHIINFSIPGINNEFLVLQLDAAGIAVSTKSACLRDEDESYVVAALGKGRDVARTSIRISLGRSTRRSDLVAVIRLISKLKTDAAF